MRTMTKSDFFEAWRAECREWFAILAVVRRDRLRVQRPKMGASDPDAEETTRRQKFFRGPLLQDRIASGELVVEGWVGVDLSVGVR